MLSVIDSGLIRSTTINRDDFWINV